MSTTDRRGRTFRHEIAARVPARARFERLPRREVLMRVRRVGALSKVDVRPSRTRPSGTARSLVRAIGVAVTPWSVEPVLPRPTTRSVPPASAVASVGYVDFDAIDSIHESPVVRP
jgi:hypothetical protein